MPTEDQIVTALLTIADATSKTSPGHPRNDLGGKVRDILGLTEKPAEPAPEPHKPFNADKD